MYLCFNLSLSRICAIGNGIGKIVNVANQMFDSIAMLATGGKITTHSFVEIFGLANIDDFSFFVQKPIYPRLIGKILDFGQ